MDEQRIQWSEEIARLREGEGMTFKAIGERYQISPEKASYLYQSFLRRRRPPCQIGGRKAAQSWGKGSFIRKIY